MWNMKKSLLFAIALVAVILISMNMASANPVTNWLTNEKNKIVEYQTKSWADSKAQLANTKKSILNLFKKKNDARKKTSSLSGRKTINSKPFLTLKKRI